MWIDWGSKISWSWGGVNIFSPYFRLAGVSEVYQPNLTTSAPSYPPNQQVFDPNPNTATGSVFGGQAKN